MSFLSLTSLSATCVRLDLGAYASPTEARRATPQYLNPKHIKKVRIKTEVDPEVVEIESVFEYTTTQNEPLLLTWEIGSPPHMAFVVSFINGIAPTSAADLAEKLALLMV